MSITRPSYRALVTSDWSECLSPNGPFDPISFIYPHLATTLRDIFKQYTGNKITLRQATSKIGELLPSPFTEDQMSSYLESSFQTYSGVKELIEWCLGNDILFMLNTTGTKAYFQQAMENGLLPRIPIIAANPMISFNDDDPTFLNEVHEIEDKAVCSKNVADAFGFPGSKIVVMGDSGGDGPHFRWAYSIGAYTVGNMTKHSLTEYCRTRDIKISQNFGLIYGQGEERKPDLEMKVDYKLLIDVVKTVLLDK